MTQFISYQEWTSQYEHELMRLGAERNDACLAAQLGWNIVKAHQACYGVHSTTPAHFSLAPMAEQPRALASCSGKKSEMPDCYVVFVQGLYGRLGELQQFYGDGITLAVVLEGIAVHEVRHRVQDREAQSVTLFKRSKLEGIWPNNLFAQVCWDIHQDFIESEVASRNAGMSEEDIQWVFSDNEYDAAVVERLFTHLHGTIATDEQLAKFIRMSCPRLDFIRRT
jgi:hypothetical protein